MLFWHGFHVEFMIPPPMHMISLTTICMHYSPFSTLCLRPLLLLSLSCPISYLIAKSLEKNAPTMNPCHVPSTTEPKPLNPKDNVNAKSPTCKKSPPNHRLYQYLLHCLAQCLPVHLPTLFHTRSTLLDSDLTLKLIGEL